VAGCHKKDTLQMDDVRGKGFARRRATAQRVRIADYSSSPTDALIDLKVGCGLRRHIPIRIRDQGKVMG
jgi:hypothetical protein